MKALVYRRRGVSHETAAARKAKLGEERNWLTACGAEATTVWLKAPVLSATETKLRRPVWPFGHALLTPKYVRGMFHSRIGGVGMFDRLRRDWHLRDIDKRIGKHGWTAVYVGDYEQAPTWVYTIGLTETLNQPEVVLFDIPQADANSLLWTVAEALKEGSLTLVDGLPWPEDADSKMIWRKVHPSQIDSPDTWFAAALGRRRNQRKGAGGLEVFQLVLPDREGRSPWDVGYDETVRVRQPALYLPAVDPKWQTPKAREALRLVAERGWTTVAVAGPELEWAYSVGFADGPAAAELIGFGPAHGVARFLEETRAHLADGRLVLSDGLRWDALGLEGCWRKVHESQVMGFQWLLLAKAHAEERAGRRVGIDAFQFVVPDNRGRYPWDDGCDKGLRTSQPQLHLPLDLSKLPRSALAAGGGV